MAVTWREPCEPSAKLVIVTSNVFPLAATAVEELSAVEMSTEPQGLEVDGCWTSVCEAVPDTPRAGVMMA